MKQFKKLIAVALVFAMVIPVINIVAPQMKEVQAEESANQDDKLLAGYYTDNTYEHVVKVIGGTPKHVNAGLLNLKLQLKDNGDSSYSLRLISSIDSLNYKNVGFRISVIKVIEDGDNNITEEELVKTWTTQQVVRRINAKTSGRLNFEYNYSPKVIDTASEYFVTGVIKNIKNTTQDFLVQPFWTTMDGTEVRGQTRWFSIDDMIGDAVDNRINIPVEMDKEAYDAVGESVTINGTAYDIFERYHDGVYGHFSVNVDNATTVDEVEKRADLPSASTVIIGDKEVIYRNLYTAAVKANKTKADADITFYDLYKGKTNEFTIATAADLYGLSWLDGLGADGTTPAKFYLVSDIVLNDFSLGEDGMPVLNGTPLEWRSSYFRGELDGQMHTISGLYQTGTVHAAGNTVGMFLKTYSTTVLKNFKLVDSYIATTTLGAGSIVGQCAGSTIDTVFSSATVSSSATRVGGLIGYTSTGTTVINNCQYAGKIYTSKTGNFVGVGGIIATNTMPLVMKNCLFNGELNFKSTATGKVLAGGLIGTIGANTDGDWTAITTAPVEILGCMSVGKYNFGASQVACGTLVGEVTGANDKSILRNNVGYASNLSVLSTGKSITTTNNTDKSDITGAEGWANTLLNNDYFVAVKDAVPELKSFSTRTTEELADVPAVRAADLGWYNTTDTEFILYTEEEFLGFMQKAGAYENKQIINFEGVEIKLGADMVLNEGDSSSWDTTPPAHTYTPIIPYEARAFQGTFNGQGHTISGLYMNSTGQIVALFKYAGPKSVIKDFCLINSYIQGTDTVGSIVARSYGSTVQDVYSDATLVATTGSCNGGIVAQSWTSDTMPADNELSISNCWYAGEIILNGTNVECHTGGILGENRFVSAIIDNCLYSGWITTYSDNNYLYIGGINGSTGEITNTANPTTKISNCIITGDWNLLGGSARNNVATVIGYAYSDESTITNCYGRYAAWKYAYAFLPSLSGTENKQAQADAVSTYVLPDDALINNQLPGFGTEPWIYIQDGTPELRSFMKGTAYVEPDTQITSETIGNGETVQP